MTNTKMIKIGLVGLGYWGPNLLRNLLRMPNVAVVACADLEEERLKNVYHVKPEIQLTQNYKTLLRQDLDAVVVATPPKTHYKIAKDALIAGKHVLVEKPITINYQDAQQLIQLAQKRKRILMVDHVFVYSSPIVKLKELIEKKVLGEIYYFDSTRVNLGLFQKDTSVLWDLACHDFAILDFLIREKPLSISCMGGVHTKSGQIDTAYITCKYRSNFLAHINVNWLAPTKIRRIMIGGSQKMVVYDEGNVEERIKVYDKGITVGRDVRRRAQVNYRVGEIVAPFIPADEALAHVCRHFVACILRKQVPLSDGVAGSRVVRLLELADLSLKLGQSVKFTHADYPA